MPTERFTFPGHNGLPLAARLDLPEGPHLATALFAHCFTCSKDITAARDLLAGEGRKVGIVGYCWGGSLAWHTAMQLTGFGAAVGYYGGEIPKAKDAKPTIPTMLHFGEHDTGIPMDGVREVEAAHPDIPIHIYDAGHGFSCDERASFDEASHRAALDRTLAFFHQHLS